MNKKVRQKLQEGQTPLTGNRKVASVEASFGLGKALVSGDILVTTYTDSSLDAPAPRRAGIDCQGLGRRADAAGGRLQPASRTSPLQPASIPPPPPRLSKGR
jgi:hypothetical protein